MDSFDFLLRNNLYYYFLVSVAFVIVFILISRFLYRLQGKSPGYLKNKRDLVVIKLIKYVVFILMFAFYLHIMGVDVSSILAFTGIGGIAFSFAAQDVVKNFFGFLIFEFELPFSIGQEISISKLGIEGKIYDIGWRMIKVVTKDGHMIMIPNSVFINETVVLRYVKL